MKRAMYAGSFDPVTAGHLDIIRRADALFDEVVVAVGHNPSKKYWFGLEQRIELIAAAVGSPTVDVVALDGLLVDLCREREATAIVRGIRSGADFELEARYGLANRDLSGIETMFLLAEPSVQFVSSSLVKEIFVNGGDVSRYVPANVLDALKHRMPA